MPLVLVQNPVIVNEGYDWKDIVGEQYHFPNQYKNRCVPGTPFVYYRGTRRLGGRRGSPEYFGQGRIGRVWRDESVPISSPKKDWAWFCSIEDYVPFNMPVPWKLDGQTLEKIPANHWSVGIRPLSAEIFQKILTLAGTAPTSFVDTMSLPPIETVKIKEADATLLIRRKSSAGQNSDLSGGRYSRNAAWVGRRAEELVHRFLVENATRIGAKDIRWVAQEGSTPGWDIDYNDASGSTVAVEVKGTTAPCFGSIEITAGEWNAALTMGDRYWLYLVANCCSEVPTIQRLCNPSQLVSTGGAEVLPLVFRFSAVARS